ncbi:amidohydrolase, partial [Listeria booriae]
LAVQTIISRRLNPFDVGSITIGSFDGKGSFNVIKDAVELEGDVRAMTEETRVLIEKEFRRILDGLAKMFGITYDLDYKNDYPVLMNDENLTAFVASSLQNANIPEITTIVRCEPQPPSEDFAYYAKERPSSFFYVGAMPANGVCYPHHHPKFDINEASLLIAAKAMGTLVADYGDYKEE